MGHKIQIKSLTHSFGERCVLSDIKFECATGEIIGVLGRNGAGKSTLFNILFGTLRPSSSEIYFDNRLVKYGNKPSNFISYHTQEIMMPKHIRVRSLIDMYLPLEKQNKVFYAHGIHEMETKRINELSLGQQRYLQLLLLINLEHPIVILDEPFSMVEPMYKNLIKEKIIECKAHKGFLISDHYYLDVLEIADKVNLIKDGKMLPVAKPSDLIDMGYLSDKSVLY